MRLKHMGITMNRKKVQRLMRKYNLCCPIRKANPYRRMAKALRTSTIAPNYVKRQFRSYGPRKVLLTDITYLRLKQKHVYLSVIKDAYTMQILAYQLSESLEIDFVLETIKSLMRNHLYEMNAEVWIHSDQGCHCSSLDSLLILCVSDVLQFLQSQRCEPAFVFPDFTHFIPQTGQFT